MLKSHSTCTYCEYVCLTIYLITYKNYLTDTVTCRGKGETTRTRARSYVRTFPNPEALSPDIEEGAVN